MSEALNSVDFQGQETCTWTQACTITKNKQAELLLKMILKTQSKSGHLSTMLNSTGKSICNTSTQGNNILVPPPSSSHPMKKQWVKLTCFGWWHSIACRTCQEPPCVVWEVVAHSGWRCCHGHILPTRTDFSHQEHPEFESAILVWGCRHLGGKVLRSSGSALVELWWDSFSLFSTRNFRIGIRMENWTAKLQNEMLLFIPLIWKLRRCNNNSKNCISFIKCIDYACSPRHGDTTHIIHDIRGHCGWDPLPPPSPPPETKRKPHQMHTGGDNKEDTDLYALV